MHKQFPLFSMRFTPREVCRIAALSLYNCKSAHTFRHSSAKIKQSPPKTIPKHYNQMMIIYGLPNDMLDCYVRGCSPRTISKYYNQMIVMHNLLKFLLHNQRGSYV